MEGFLIGKNGFYHSVPVLEGNWFFELCFPTFHVPFGHIDDVFYVVHKMRQDKIN